MYYKFKKLVIHVLFVLMYVFNSFIFMVISKSYSFYPIHLRNRMNRHRNRLFLGLFLNVTLIGFFWGFFSLRIQNQLS